MERIEKENYYLDIAQTVLERSTCLRRRYGAIIVRNDEIVATGYNGAPRGRKNCSDLGCCVRERMCVPRGERYELCRSVHAEANAIISAARNECIGGTLYLVGEDAKTGEILREDRGDLVRCNLLLHVQAADHQRRPFARGHPRDRADVYRGAGAAVDRAG